MDTQDYAGGSALSRQRLRHSNLQQRLASEALLFNFVEFLAHTDPKTFARLAQAFAKADRAVEAEILRLWGIRR